MCDPLTATAVIGSAAGSMINAKEQQDTLGGMINARNQATQAELARQSVYQGQANDQFKTSLDSFSPENQAKALATDQAQTTGMLKDNSPTAAQVGSITTANAPKVVGDSEQSKLGQVFARNASLADAKGTLDGYNQRFLGNNIGLNQAGRNIDMIGDFAKTSAGVNGLEQTAAYKNAYRPPSGLGDILQTGGALAAYGAGKGMKLPFGSPSPSPYSSGAGGYKGEGPFL